MSKEIVSLKRYEYSIDNLFNICKSKKLTFKDYKHWQDKNDTILIDNYKQKSGNKFLRFLCLNQGAETIHHWNTFANKGLGCCIEYDKNLLLNSIVHSLKGKKSRKGFILYKEITYLKYNNIDNFYKQDRKYISNTILDDILFTKRYPYSIENEYRYVYISKNKESEINVLFEPKMIKRINIGGAVSTDIFECIKEKIKTLNGYENVKITHSKIYEYKSWIDKIVANSKRLHQNGN